MLLKRTVFLAVFALIISVSVYGQRPKVHNGGKSVYTVKRFNYKATRVRGEKAKIVCPIFSQSKYPFHGFGFKLGDPFAITYKYYANKRLAFAFDVGKPASSLYNRYYREKFDSYVTTDTFKLAESQLVPITHKVLFDLVAEAKALYHIDVDKISPGLQLYVGAGWEWKRTSLQYDYTWSSGSFKNNDEFGRFKRNRFTMGPQLVMGIEYAYFHLPISAFMELEYFSDIQADPGYSRLEGGVGLRYVF